MDETKLALLTLTIVPGIGVNLLESLLDYFESPQSALAASELQLMKVPGIGRKIARAIHETRDSDATDQQVESMAEHGVRFLTIDDDEFPRPLREAPDSTRSLFVKGQFIPDDALSIGIVGSRRCSHYGARTTEQLASGLARMGFTIVSGLARGIDAHAHNAALKVGGRTIAFLANGLSTIYPPEHSKLANEIVDAGGVLATEFRMEVAPVAGHFPRRNRLIAAMSLGSVIIEAAARSGALITARFAGEMGKEVFAVPGAIDSSNSRGTNRLIQQGAKLVMTVDDILEELGPLAESLKTTTGREVRQPAELKLNERERHILELMSDQPLMMDDIVVASGLATAHVSGTLMVLEMKRLVRKLEGNRYVRR